MTFSRLSECIVDFLEKSRDIFAVLKMDIEEENCFDTDLEDEEEAGIGSLKEMQVLNGMFLSKIRTMSGYYHLYHFKEK